MLKSERRFKALVQEGYDLIGILDAEGNYTYVSPLVRHTRNYSEEFIGRNALEFVHQDDVESTLASLQKIATDKG
jgi:PAS domain S-box-containing protein